LSVEIKSSITIKSIWGFSYIKKLNMIAIRPMVYLTLTFDHHILDVAITNYFLAEMVKELEQWEKSF